MIQTDFCFTPTKEQLDSWAEWCAERPPHVREVAERFPPWSLWRLDLTNEDGAPSGRYQRVFPVSFGENPDGSVTLTVAVTMEFNDVAFGRQVFGIHPEDLTPTTLPRPGETARA